METSHTDHALETETTHRHRQTDRSQARYRDIPYPLFEYSESGYINSDPHIPCNYSVLEGLSVQQSISYIYPGVHLSIFQLNHH